MKFEAEISADLHTWIVLHMPRTLYWSQAGRRAPNDKYSALGQVDAGGRSRLKSKILALPVTWRCARGGHWCVGKQGLPLILVSPNRSHAGRVSVWAGFDPNNYTRTIREMRNGKLWRQTEYRLLCGSAFWRPSGAFIG